MNQRNNPEIFQTANLIAVNSLEVMNELVESDSYGVQKIFEFGHKKDTRWAQVLLHI